jgi:hypothetical protein
MGKENDVPQREKRNHPFLTILDSITIHNLYLSFRRINLNVAIKYESRTGGDTVRAL